MKKKNQRWILCDLLQSSAVSRSTSGRPTSPSHLTQVSKPRWLLLSFTVELQLLWKQRWWKVSARMKITCRGTGSHPCFASATSCSREQPVSFLLRTPPLLLFLPASLEQLTFGSRLWSRRDLISHLHNPTSPQLLSCRPSASASGASSSRRACVRACVPRRPGR